MTVADDIVIRRILVALDTSRRGAAAVRAAAELAAAVQAELLGLFVEDINLLRLADLPFAREMGLHSAASRPLDFAAVEQALRAQAAQVERLLARAAERQRLRWSFQVTRGQVVAEVLAVARDVDLVVVGKAGRSIGARLGGAGHREAARGEAVPARRPLVLVFDGSEPAARALRLAARLAREAGKALVAMIAAPKNADYQRLREQVEAVADPARQRVRCHQVKAAIGDVCRGARGVRAELVVLGAPGDSRSAQELVDSLLEAMDCPLVLVR
ncbi:MAG: universal stress protein [Betaproteobacteria bacterium]|nr:universal stress protein [Betaproteobacteria bacterium]